MTVKIFFSYAHQDKNLAYKLRRHLKPLQLAGYIDVWYDHDINAGSNRESEILRQLGEAQIILLLISSEYLDSDHCYSVELQQALARHSRGEAHVVPIILRPVHWQIAPFGKFQALPKNEKPITLWAPQDLGFKEVAMGVHEVVQHWYAYKLPYPKEERKKLLVGFSQLIETVKTQMQPPARAEHTAGTLQQLSLFIPDGVTLADLIVGWQTLSRPSQKGDDPPTTSRRITCGELANFASQLTTDQGDLSQAIKTWGIWRDAFEKSDDPRQQAMAKTFDREVTELREAAR